MNHKERLNAESRIVLTKESEDFTAYCGPECDGDVFLDGEVIGDAPRSTEAPFPIDIVFGERYPHDGEVEELIEELAPHFGDLFDSKIDEVWELINNSDDPLQEIADAKPDELL